MSDCNHTLLPYTGTWVNITIGEESERQIYCAECGDVFCVRRKNISSEKIGNIHTENE